MENFSNVLKCLNDAIRADYTAIHNVFESRFDCNGALADHEHIVVSVETKDSEEYKIGALGIINGVLTSLGYPRVMAIYDSNDDIIEIKEYDCN